MENDRLIQAYFKGSLSQDEKEHFKQLMAKDTQFKAEFEAYKSLHTAFQINNAEDLKQQLKAVESTQKKASQYEFKRRSLYLIAASLVALIGLSVYLNINNQTLYATYFEIYPNVYQPVERGNSQKEDRIAPFVPYENGDYKEATAAFKVLLKSEDSPEIRFYYALSLLNHGKSQAALAEFNRLKDQKFEFQAEVYWYAALAEIKLDNFSKAEVILKEMQRQKFTFNQDNVKSLLNELNHH